MMPRQVTHRTIQTYLKPKVQYKILSFSSRTSYMTEMTSMPDA